MFQWPVVLLLLWTGCWQKTLVLLHPHVWKRRTKQDVQWKYYDWSLSSGERRIWNGRIEVGSKCISWHYFTILDFTGTVDLLLTMTWEEKKSETKDTFSQFRTSFSSPAKLEMFSSEFGFRWDFRKFCSGDNYTPTSRSKMLVKLESWQ